MSKSRERERVLHGAERKRGRKIEDPGAGSNSPRAGLDLINHEIMT